MSKAFFHEYKASFCVHVAISSKSIRTNIHIKKKKVVQNNLIKRTLYLQHSVVMLRHFSGPAQSIQMLGKLFYIGHVSRRNLKYEKTEQWCLNKMLVAKPWWENEESSVFGVFKRQKKMWTERREVHAVVTNNQSKHSMLYSSFS